MAIYVVQPGDTVDKIAALFQVSAESLIYDNQIVPPYALAVGQALFIPQTTSDSTSPALVAFGYAYTSISPWVLDQTLPFLTDLHIFSYGFTMEGDLIPPLLEDTWIVRAAAEYGVRAILTLTPFGPDGKFNNALIHSVLNNPQYQESLIDQIQQVLELQEFSGVDVDFEYILAEDKNAFTAFVEALAERLHQYGYTVSVALAPKVSAEQQGLLYEGKDYPALGTAADSVLLMTYEWGYKYGPNMAVAPLNQVRRVVDYAVAEIPRDKINLGIPNYGYDWPLPYIPNVTAATTIGNVEAVQIAIQNNAVIQFDETAQSPFFRYFRENTEHEVWFEDVRSIQAKFNLIRDYGLKGAGYWQLMRWWRANWLLMQENFRIV